MPFQATPTLVIGLGGTGLKVATYVKKSVMEANGNVMPKGLQILVFDTEATVKFVAGTPEAPPRDAQHSIGPVQIANAGEYVPITGNVSTLASQVRAEQQIGANDASLRPAQPHRHINSWFQADYYIGQAGLPSQIWDLNVGAGAFRQFGRLALFTNVRLAVNQLTAALDALRRMGATQVQTHIVGSMVGGTGAALFVDLAHLVQQLCRNQLSFQNETTLFGHCVLPEAFRGTRDVKLSDELTKADIDARAFAALRELTRLQGTGPQNSGGYPLVYEPQGDGAMRARIAKGPLYNAVYLYDGIRSNNPLNADELQKGLAPAIADAIVAYLDPESQGQFAAGAVNDASRPLGQAIPTGEATYATIGAYTVELPIYHIMEGWAHDLAHRALDQLLLPKTLDPTSQLVTSLYEDRPGHRIPASLDDSSPAARENPVQSARDWMRGANITQLVTQLLSWAREARQNRTVHDETVQAILNVDAEGWNTWLAPGDPSWASMVADANTHLRGSLKNNKDKLYFVAHHPNAQTQAQSAAKLMQNTEAKLSIMVGPVRGVWRREGGAYGASVMRLTKHHGDEFLRELSDHLQLLLDGRDSDSSQVARKAGKLGFVAAFLTELSSLAGEACGLFEEADDATHQQARKTQWQGIQAGRQQYQDEMQSSAGFLDGNMKGYRDRSDDLAQFHKSDIAREVVAGLAKRLLVIVRSAQDEVARWQEALATAVSARGGAYALVLEGQELVRRDRELSSSAARWLIRDDEPGDTYIAEKRQKYERGDAVQRVLAKMSWTVTQDPGQSKITLGYGVNSQPWLRQAGAVDGAHAGRRNANTLIDVCREIYRDAQTDMSVLGYLLGNYETREAELAQKLLRGSGYPLAYVDTVQGQQGQLGYATRKLRLTTAGTSGDVQGFLDHLVTALNIGLHQGVAPGGAQAASNGAAGGRAAGVGGLPENCYPSVDRFKLSFFMFNTRLRTSQIKVFSDAQEHYRSVSSTQQRWRRLHVLPAETNSIAIEQRVTLDNQLELRQKRRELSERVVFALEDYDRFSLAMRCLAYGDPDFQWGQGTGQGLLLHRRPEPGAQGQSQNVWQLVLQPQGELRPDGRRYVPGTSYLAKPERFELSNPAPKPSLVDAVIQLVCLGRSRGEQSVAIDLAQVEATLRYAEQRAYETQRSELSKYWVLFDPGKTAVLDDSYRRVSLILELRDLMRMANEKLSEHRWAWRSDAGKAPDTMDADTQHAMQEEMDLWTALRGAAQHEIEAQDAILADRGRWLVIEDRSVYCMGPVPHIMPADIAQCPTCGLPPLVCSGPLSHFMRPGQPFCTKCGAPMRQSEPPLVCSHPGHHPMARGERHCSIDGWTPLVCSGEAAHAMAPGEAVCRICRKPLRTQQPPQPPSDINAGVRVCSGPVPHPMPSGAAFCQICGQPARQTAAPQGMVCSGPVPHPMPPGAAFCQICGQPARQTSTPQGIVCSGPVPHPMPSGVAFCSICGAPSKGKPAAAPVEPPLTCLRGHSLAQGANFCPICGSAPLICSGAQPHAMSLGEMACRVCQYPPRAAVAPAAPVTSPPVQVAPSPDAFTTPPVITPAVPEPVVLPAAPVIPAPAVNVPPVPVEQTYIPAPAADALTGTILCSGEVPHPMQLDDLFCGQCGARPRNS